MTRDATDAKTTIKHRRKYRGFLWNWSEYLLLIGITWILKLVPHRASNALAAFGGASYGALCRLLNMRDHRVATINLELAYPEKSIEERNAIIRSMWRMWGRFVSDGVQMTKMSPERLRGIVRIDSKERFLEISEKVKKRGVLVLTAHFGSFEMLHAAVSAHGIPVTLVHRPMANPLVSTWLYRLRTRFGTRALARGEAARDVLKALRDGTVVAIPFDQTANKDTRVWAPFFGVPAATNSGLARLAHTSGAPVYPVLLIREGESLRHKIYIGPEIPIVKTGDKERDVEQTTILFNKTLEGLIRANPDHWIWMYRRFKQRPDAGCSPYHSWAPPLESYRVSLNN
ncbi:MAG: lysophospholipid acyltransferase family protein [Planctomycetota bacterium]